MWPNKNKLNQLVSPKSLPMIKDKMVHIPEAEKNPIQEEPTMKMFANKMSTNPMPEKGRMFHNLKTFLDKNNLNRKI